MTHRGAFQPQTFCDSVKTLEKHEDREMWSNAQLLSSVKVIRLYEHFPDS